MRIVEIRDLDGPNLFLMGPAIKIEIADIPEDQIDTVAAGVASRVGELHQALGLAIPEIISTRMELPGHAAVAFAWSQRAFAGSLARWAAQLVIGERTDPEQVVHELREIRAQQPDEDDSPMLVRAYPDRIPIVSITGTNGKTTTSRLIAYVLRHAGHSVGLTSSAGVFINKTQVLEGDYSGPGGAQRVLHDPSVEYAVLETARGGLLLRGSGYEAADVAVITNVSEDHLGLHGIVSIDGLAAVKAIVARNIRPGGFCVLNAEDENVLAMREITPGTPVLFSPIPDGESMQAHIEAGGSAISVDAQQNVVWVQDGESEIVTSVASIPMTFNGKASHQVENALAAIAALIGLGIDMDTIRAGVQNFKSSAEDSKGRLNVYDVDGATAIVDFAHNEAGLIHLLNFSRTFVESGRRLIAVIGTAGDRDNSSLRGIARRAVTDADMVVLKDSLHYLRGRQPGEMLAEMRAAIDEMNRPEIEVLESPDERNATLMMLEQLEAGDVLAVMCVEDYDFLLTELGQRGTAKA